MPDSGGWTTQRAVEHFWATVQRQGATDSPTRSNDAGRQSVVGGKQLDGFAELIAEQVAMAGINADEIFWSRKKELPGYFRATKQWDLLVVREQRLLAAIELKSISRSFGNNLNNRVEEAVGSATDLTRALREGAFGTSSNPWVGYFFICVEQPGPRGSTHPVAHAEPHFPALDAFRGASYLKRGEELCRRLVTSRLYNQAWYVTTTSDRTYQEPARDLSGEVFLTSLRGHLNAQAKV